MAEAPVSVLSTITLAAQHWCWSTLWLTNNKRHWKYAYSATSATWQRRLCRVLFDDRNGSLQYLLFFVWLCGVLGCCDWNVESLLFCHPGLLEPLAAKAHVYVLAWLRDESAQASSCLLLTLIFGSESRFMSSNHFISLALKIRRASQIAK